MYIMRYIENFITFFSFFFLLCVDRAVVHEWAKFRYGVFEEKGYENDPIYPMAYHMDGRDDERKPTSCTNRPLKGNW